MQRGLRAIQAVMGVLVGLSGAEVAFTIRDQGAFPHLNVYRPDDTLGVRLQPGASQRVAFLGNPVTDVTINAEGYRGADWGPPQPDEVIVVGDSQVFGLGVEAEETASAALSSLLHRPVRNAGTPTWGPDEYTAAVQELVAARAPRDVVVVFNMANDLFELGRPNPQRHAVWDGWAVRRETAPEAVLEFPGRSLLYRRSHLFFALRRLWASTLPAPSTDGFSSEGSWSDLVALSSPGVQGAPPGPTPDTLYRQLFPGEGYKDNDLNALVWAQSGAHPGDIVFDTTVEASRPIRVTAEQLRRGAEILAKRRARLEEYAAKNPDTEAAKQIYAAFAAGHADALSGFLPWVVNTLKASGDARLWIVVLPLDVQVSEAEWAKYDTAPQDMTRVNDLTRSLGIQANRAGARAIDPSTALAHAEPGAFLHGDLHMTPKGQAALAAEIAAAFGREIR